MPGRLHEGSATVLQFPVHAIHRKPSAVARNAPGIANLQTIQPIVDTDGWYHEEAMREEERERHS